MHFRLASPPILYPDYYGIDLPDRGGLLAATHSLEEMREIIGADSLAFLSIDGMYRAMGEPGRDPANPKFSDHCFTGAYPTHLTDQTQVEAAAPATVAAGGGELAVIPGARKARTRKFEIILHLPLARTSGSGPADHPGMTASYFVMAGLVPAIHVCIPRRKERGCPGQARA